jgi:hypothetical protein
MTRAVRFVCAMTLGLANSACKSNEPPSTDKVSTSTLQPGPVRHDELSPDLVARITQLHDTFQDVDPTPLSKWLDDFKRDQDPVREIRIYEAMARAYTAYCGGRDLTADAKREVYGVVLQRSGESDDDVLKHLKLKSLSIDDAKAILKLYDIPPAPITVTTSPTP